LNILFLTSEAVPFAKTGGLGDVSGVLPRVLSKSEDVSLMLPDYMTESIGRLRPAPIAEFALQIGTEIYPAVIKKAEISNKFSVFFIANERFFGRKFLYGDAAGDYADNFLRFLFFQKAALAFVGKHGLHFDVIHCNDWQTALVPLYVRLESSTSLFSSTKTVFSIHNLGYQGIFAAGFFKQTGLPDYLFSPEYLEFYGNLNCLKAGIIFSDHVVTVSPSYAREIVLAEKGFGLDGLLNKFSFKLNGILNGVDYSVWNPALDPFIAFRYAQGTLAEKRKNKQKLFAELGIVRDDRSPLLVMISRISEQKGVELLLELLPVLLKEKIYFIFLGVGDKSLTKRLKEVADRFHDSMTFLNYFDERKAHQLQAAGDILFMPSVYEPCGLNQIYGMKYGTVPVVRATGGLDDSVREFDPATRQGTGFKFKGPGVEEVMAVMRKALQFHADERLWRVIQKNGMGMDFSWDRTAPKYIDLYNKILVEDTPHG
jgi:starch synthase